MKQTKLFNLEQKRLNELRKYNYSNSRTICDIYLADKLKGEKNDLGN